MANASAVSRALGKSFTRSTSRPSRVRGYSTYTSGFQCRQVGNAVLVEHISGSGVVAMSDEATQRRMTDCLTEYANTLAERWDVVWSGSALAITNKAA